MTAAEAIASIREDIDRLERKRLVKQGHIGRRRAELDAIERELASLEGQIDERDFAAIDLLRIIAGKDARLAQFADRIRVLCEVLAMVGVNPSRFLRMPLGITSATFTEARAILVEMPEQPSPERLAVTICQLVLAIDFQQQLAPEKRVTAEKFIHATRKSTAAR